MAKKYFVKLNSRLYGTVSEGPITLARLNKLKKLQKEGHISQLRITKNFEI